MCQPIQYYVHTSTQFGGLPVRHQNRAGASECLRLRDANKRRRKRKAPYGHPPAERTHAGRFGKARLARSNALREDYVQLIVELLTTEGEARPTNIARRLGVSHVCVIKAIARLNRDGLVVAPPYRGVFLTAVGRALAERVRLRHRIVVDLLRAGWVPTEAAEADAEGIKHLISNATLKAFGRYLQTLQIEFGSVSD